LSFNAASEIASSKVKVTQVNGQTSYIAVALNKPKIDKFWRYDLPEANNAIHVEELILQYGFDSDCLITVMKRATLLVPLITGLSGTQLSIL